MKQIKAKFGTKEVILVCLATALYLGAEWLQQSLVAYGIVGADSYNYFKLRVLAITLSATVQGPIVGLLVAIGGTLLANEIFYGYISGAEIVAYVVNAIVIGYYSDRLRVLKGGFGRKEILDFNVIQIVTNIFCSLMFSPLFLFITEGMNLGLAVNTGSKSAIGNVLGIGVLGTLILMIISKVINIRHPELSLQDDAPKKVVGDIKPIEFDERVRTMYKERL